MNDNKKIQSLDSIETYAYGTSRDLVSKKEEIKYNNKLKQCKKLLTLWCYKRKHKRTWSKLKAYKSTT